MSSNSQQAIKKKKSVLSYKKKKKSLTELEKQLRTKMYDRYKVDGDTYNIKVINEIIYNEKSQIVATFKDYLIYDDLSEFMKRFYKSNESFGRLPKIFDYYENYSKIFPNYINIPEAKYIYKNIQKKQKMIDNQQRLEADQQEKERKKNDELIKQTEEKKIFDTEIYNSIMNQTESHVKDESLANILNEKNLNILERETSYMSIENLIDTIGFSEKLDIKKDDTAPNTQRENISITKKVLSPLNKKILMANKEKMNYRKNESNPKENSPLIKSTKFFHKKNTPSESNDIISNILNHKKNEAKTAGKKFKEIRQKNKMSSDISHLTAMKEKLKLETNNNFASCYYGQTNKGYTCSASKDKKRAIIKQPSSRQNVLPDSARTKATSNIFSNIANSGSTTLSARQIAELRQKGVLQSKHPDNSNIFYIINQNPQVNNQITIFNNEKSSEKNIQHEQQQKKNDSNINSLEISRSKLNSARETSSNTNTFMKAVEKTSSKQFQNLKPEFINMFNKNKASLENNYVKNPKSKNGLRNSYAGKQDSNQMKDISPIKVARKKEKQQTPALTAREMGPRHSLVTSNRGEKEDNQIKSSKLNPLGINGKLRTRKVSPLLKDNFYVSNNHKNSDRDSITSKKKSSISPLPSNKNSTKYNGSKSPVWGQYQRKKIKTKEEGGKKQYDSMLEINQNSKNPPQANMKGIQIKNFNDVIRNGSLVGKVANSDRLNHKKMTEKTKFLK